MDIHHWPSITRRIVATGLTQPEIAKACGCSQSSISDVLKGRTKDPRASIALSLIRLAKERGVDTATAATEAPVEGARHVVGAQP